jgi:hypothetical protein
MTNSADFSSVWTTALSTSEFSRLEKRQLLILLTSLLKNLMAPR